jgi:hypothetical protein
MEALDIHIVQDGQGLARVGTGATMAVSVPIAAGPLDQIGCRVCRS